MGVYPDKIASLAAVGERPRLPSEEACGAAASFECGCIVRFFVAIDTVGTQIGSISYTTNGCGYMVASSEALSRNIEGRRLDDLHALDVSELLDQVANELGEFPSPRRQCAAIAIQALRGAFADHRTRVIEEFRGERPLICTCFGVSEDAIVKMVESGKAVSADEVFSLTRAGTGCGSCRMLIDEIVESSRMQK